MFWLTVGGPLILKTAGGGWVSAAGFLACFYGCLVGSKIAVAAAIGRSRHLLTSRGYVWLVRSLGLLLVMFAALFVREGLTYWGIF